MRRHLQAALFTAIGVSACLTAFAQTPPPTPTPQQPAPTTFRAGVRTIPVWTTVNDKTGALMTDLKQEDFELRDNGKVQELTQFTSVQQPISTVIMIDGSGSMLPAFSAVLEGASAFVIRMLPEDQARVGSFADLIKMGPRFTSNRDELLEFLQNEFNIRMGNETRLWDGMREAVLAASQAESRRVVLVFSDGFDTASTTTVGRVMTDARERDVIIYAIAMWTGRGPHRQRPSRDLEILAGDTGGGYYELSEADEMNSTFSRIAMELHHQYVLGFTPKAFDGKLHTIDVRVKRPDMKVRARKSYVAEIVERR